MAKGFPERGGWWAKTKLNFESVKGFETIADYCGKPGPSSESQKLGMNKRERRGQRDSQKERNGQGR